MSDTRLRAGDGGDFARVEMNTMTEHGSGREQSTFFVNVGVVPRRHVEVVHFFELFPVLGEMSLQISIETRRHFRGATHQFLRAGNGKARTESVFEPAIFGAMPFSTKPFTFQ